LPPSGHARNLRSAEVTPILNSFPTGNNAEIRAAVNNEARAFSVGDDDVEAGVVDVNVSGGNADDGFGIVGGHSYFGDQPNPNPEDRSDTEGEFILLFCSLQKCSEKYPKAKKVDIFYQALTIHKSKILGNSPPAAVRMKFDAWIQAVKSRGMRKLDAIAMSVFLIARHVHDRQEKFAMSGRALTDSKIIVLVLMYRYYITEINRTELECQSQNAAAEKSLQQQQMTSKETKALPVNFCYDLSKVSFFVPDLFRQQVISMVSSSFLAASSSPLDCSIQLSFLQMCGVGHFPD
jgi:hypothetical protein